MGFFDARAMEGHIFAGSEEPNRTPRLEEAVRTSPEHSPRSRITVEVSEVSTQSDDEERILEQNFWFLFLTGATLLSRE